MTLRYPTLPSNHNLIHLFVKSSSDIRFADSTNPCQLSFSFSLWYLSRWSILFDIGYSSNTHLGAHVQQPFNANHTFLPSLNSPYASSWLHQSSFISWYLNLMCKCSTLATRYTNETTNIFLSFSQIFPTLYALLSIYDIKVSFMYPFTKWK